MNPTEDRSAAEMNPTEDQSATEMNPTEDQSAAEMNRIQATMDDLPELPFEKVLSYLNLEDRLKARAVSRRWYHKINCFKVKTLCYSDRPSGCVFEKNRLVSGAFAKNFIGSSRFASFFTTFGPTILSTLKHLRLCDFDLNNLSETTFASTLNSFGGLEELGILRVHHNFSNFSGWSRKSTEFELSLPMLRSFQLEYSVGFQNLILDTPRLQKVHLWNCCFLRLELVHCESVEWLVTDKSFNLKVKNLKNLKYLSTSAFSIFDPKILSDLDQLKELHTADHLRIRYILEQKQLYGRTDLMVYFCGLLLSGPDDPAINSLSAGSRLTEATFRCLVENRSRLLDEMPFWKRNLFMYQTIESVDPDVAIDVLSRLTGLEQLIVDRPVRDIEHFLSVLKNIDIVALEFFCDQPQELFDRLPEHSTVQKLVLYRAPSDLAFLFGLKHLVELDLRFSIDAGLIRKLFKKLKFLSWFRFCCMKKNCQIEIIHPRRFKVSVDRTSIDVPDLDAAIKLIVGTVPQEVHN